MAPSFGDIFFQNAFKNGALPIVLPTATLTEWRRLLHERPGATMTGDLESQTVSGPEGHQLRFEIDPFRKQCLLSGHDEIALTHGYEAAIGAFEARRAREMPWLAS